MHRNGGGPNSGEKQRQVQVSKNTNILRLDDTMPSPCRKEEAKGQSNKTLLNMSEINQNRTDSFYGNENANWAEIRL